LEILQRIEKNTKKRLTGFDPDEPLRRKTDEEL